MIDWQLSLPGVDQHFLRKNDKPESDVSRQIISLSRLLMVLLSAKIKKALECMHHPDANVVNVGEKIRAPFFNGDCHRMAVTLALEMTMSICPQKDTLS